MPAPKGNKNAAKGKDWETALRWALDNYSGNGIKKGQALRRIAESVVEKALAGDPNAQREIADRLDGRPAQAVTGEGGGPVIIQIDHKDVELL